MSGANLRSSLDRVRDHWDRSAREREGEHAKVDTSPGAQVLRFRVFVEATAPGGRSVLDVGCGLAHLHDHLASRSIDVDYTGIDLSPEMVARARSRRPHLRLECAELGSWDPGRRFDLVVAVGIHNVRVPRGWDVLAACLRRQFELCEVAAHVSLLSDRYAGFAPEIQPWRVEDVLSLAFEVTPHVSLRADYLPHDFSVTLHRRPLTDRTPHGG